MMIKCPTCKKPDCIQKADDVLDSIYQIYMACPECPPEPGWNKTSPLASISGDIDNKTLLCQSCSRRPLDAVIGNTLSIMIKHGDRDTDAGLIAVGTPLIVHGFPIRYPPRLGPDNLVLIADSIKPETADDIITGVPEVKGIVLRSGPQAQSVGILDLKFKPHEYRLLAGCDMRSDLAQTFFGELVIYKQQSLTHIEFDNKYKMEVLERLNGKGMLSGAVVVDGMCGSGTLGLMAMLAGAKKVIFNDAWKPAIENLLLNFQVNKDILNADLEIISPIKDLPQVGDIPIQAARAKRGGKVVAEVYFGDLRLLSNFIDMCHVCLIDTFPSADPSDFVKLWSKKTAGSNVLVI